MASRKLIVQVVGDSSDLDRALKNATDSSSRFGSKMGTAIKAGGLLAAAGIGAAVVATKGFIDAAADAERVQAKLQVALKNAGINYQENAKQIDAVIEKSSELSGFDDEDLSESLANMVRTTHDLNKAYELNALAADIARTKGMDLAAAQSLLARVYNGSFMGVKRLGVALTPVTAAQDALKESTKKATDEQTRHAKELDKVATREQAIATLQQSFAGQAEAYGNTAAGAQDRFRVALENLQETLGNVLLPTFTKWVLKLEEGVKWVQRYITALQTIQPGVEEIASSHRRWGESMAHTNTQMDSATKAAKETSAALTFLRGILDSLAPVFRAASFELKLEVDFVRALSKAVRDLVGDYNRFAGPVENARRAIQNFSVSAWQATDQAMKRIGAALRDAAVTVYNAATQIGSQIVAGIKGGFDAAWAATKGFFTDKMHDLADTLKHPWRIKSPSQTAADEIGKPIAEGIAMGYLLGIADLPAKVSAGVQKALDAAKAKIDSYRSVFETAFGELSGLASNLFGMTRKQTPAEAKLAKIQAADAAKALQDALTEAQANLERDRMAGIGLVLSGASPEEVAAAIEKVKADQQAVADAQHQIMLANLALKAEEERKQQDARDAVEAANFQKALTRLQTQLAKKGATAAQATEAILELLAKYGVNFAAVGRDAGIAYIQALKDAIAEAAGSAGELGGTIASAAGGIAVPKPKGKAVGGPVSAGGLYLVGERGPELFAPGSNGMIIPNGGGGGWPDKIQIVLDGRVLGEVLYRDLARRKLQNGRLGLA